jgi:long-chain acyl-CoA synthetase
MSHEIEVFANTADIVFRNASRRPEHVAAMRGTGSARRPVTSAELAEEVAALASGLAAAGVEPGDRVALMSGTRYEWLLCDLAIWTAGAITVPIYETSSPEQVAWILADSGAVAVFAEDRHTADVVERTRPRSVRHLWDMTGGIDLGRLIAAGREAPDDVTARRQGVPAGSPATIVYTSGTTGRPKGCMLSHANLLGEVRSVTAADGVSEAILTEQGSVLLFLPLAHILARVFALAALHNGTQLAFTSDLARLPEELRQYRPTVVLAVPRVFEKLRATAERTATAAGRGRVFRVAETVAVEYSRALDTGGPTWWLRARHRVFDRLVYSRLRAAIGGRVVYACSGGAPLGERLGHFLRGAGVNVLEGWGLTETSAGVTLNLPGAQRFGTVGRPLPGCAVRVDVDGEVLVRGPQVFAGYWGDPAATEAALDPDGWFHTGDLGELHDGYLTITGRKKDLIVTAAGKNIAPAYFEDRLRSHWLIDQCLLVGDRRPYVGALVVIDAEAFEQWKYDRGKPSEATVAGLRADPDLTADLQAAVDDVNATVSAAETIKRFRVLPGPLVVGEELTPTQKLRREFTLARFAADVEELYAAPVTSEPGERAGGRRTTT